MKLLNTPTMRALLLRGQRKASRMKMPHEGSMINLFTEDKKNGWYYQVELIHDSRFAEPKRVVVYAFRPPRVMHAKSAEYYLSAAV